MLERIIGSPEKYPIQHRFLNGACAIAIFFSLAIVISNIILGLDLVLNLILGFSFFVFCLLYYLSRVKNLFFVSLLGLALLCIIAMPAAWFLNSGLSGSTIYICFTILTLFLVIARGKTRAIITGLFSAELLAAITIEYYRPDLVVPYGSRLTQFSDHTVTIAFSLIQLIIIIMVVMRNYEEEKLKADESNRLKSYFLANISHEIRTPMNSILGFSGLLRDKALTEMEKNHFLEIIEKSGRHLLNLIDDILNLARIEAGQVTINEMPFSLDALMLELYDVFSLQIKENKKNVSLSLKKPAGVRAGTILADDFRLRQVLMNLLANAVKFTETGTIEFGYRLAGPQRLQFHVSDTGIGIDQKHVANIFQQFKQADNSHTRKYGGAGLGLTISKRLINLMGGDICLDTTPGRGTTFYFDIPLKSAGEPHFDNERAVTAPGTAGRGEWKNRTVLIVEDDNDSYRFLERVLSRYGINIIRSINGLDAVEICRNNNAIDCVLMDIQLPFISGNDAAKMIRRFRKDLPIIAQSGNAYDSDREDSIKAGCDDFITKPILPEKLLSVLDRFL